MHTSDPQWPVIYRHYQRNFCRHLGDVTRWFEHRLMQLMAERGYDGLRTTWVQVIPWLGPEGARLVDLAREQGISKQAMGQLAGEIEQQGYLLRLHDKQDQRSRRIALSAQGVTLVAEAAAAASRVQRELAQHIGTDALQTLGEQLTALFRHYRLHYPGADRHPGVSSDSAAALPMHLHGLTALFEQRLMEAAQACGHRGLKRSFGMVLLFLAENGTRIVDIARQQGISKQAVSQIAQAIEKLGYLERQDDAQDRRARRLMLTSRGRRLIRDSVLAMQALEDELAGIPGIDWPVLRDTLAGLHQRLGIPHPQTRAENTLPALQVWLQQLARHPDTRACFTTDTQGLRLSAEALQQLQHLHVPLSAADTEKPD